MTPGRKEIQIYPPLSRGDVTRNSGTKGAREVEVKVIVCFSVRSALQRFLFETLCAQEERRRHEPCHVFRMNLHDVPVYLRHFLLCVHACASRVQAPVHTRISCVYACARARGPASMWAEIPCSGRCWTIFPWPPSRYETRYDYTLSAHRRQGRTVLPDSLTRLNLVPTILRNISWDTARSRNFTRLNIDIWYDYA